MHYVSYAYHCCLKTNNLYIIDFFQCRNAFIDVKY